MLRRMRDGARKNEMKQKRIKEFLYVSRMPGRGRPFPEEPKDGLYLGNDFCEFLMPSAAQVRAGLSFCDKKGLSFALVLPWCTQSALERSRALISLLPAGTEVVFNDWGLPDLIRERGLVPIAGRLITPHSADPRADAFRQLGDQAFDRWLSASPLWTNEFREILVKKGIERIEFDNTAQGLDASCGQNLKGSLYYPYVYITTGRVCLTRYYLRGSFNPPAHSCGAPCRGMVIRRNIRSINVDVFLKGNTHFYINPHPPDEKKLVAMGMDRLVFMPDFPF
jgi:hypothetical protein